MVRDPLTHRAVQGWLPIAVVREIEHLAVDHETSREGMVIILIEEALAARREGKAES